MLRELRKAIVMLVPAYAFILLLACLQYAPWTATPVHAQLGATWTTFHAPAANTQATISKAAATGAVQVLDCVVAKLAAGAVAPAAATVNVQVRDGASGAGTVVAQWPVSIPAVAGENAPPISQCGLNIVGTAGNALTVEFSAAAGANTLESVFIKGFTR